MSSESRGCEFIWVRSISRWLIVCWQALSTDQAVDVPTKLRDREVITGRVGTVKPFSTLPYNGLEYRTHIIKSISSCKISKVP